MESFHNLYLLCLLALVGLVVEVVQLVEWERAVEVAVGIVEGSLRQEERRQEQVGVFVLIEILGIVKSTIRRLLIGLLKRLEVLLLVRRCSLDVC